MGATSSERAVRRRKAIREMRALVERTAKLRKPDHACPSCDALFDCEPGCVVADARAWLKVHREGTSE